MALDESHETSLRQSFHKYKRPKNCISHCDILNSTRHSNQTKANANDGFWTTWMDSNRVSINLFDESVLYHLPASALLSLTHWQRINYCFLYRSLYSVLVLISEANSDNSTRMRQRGIDYLKWDVKYCEWDTWWWVWGVRLEVCGWYKVCNEGAMKSGRTAYANLSGQEMWVSGVEYQM